MFRQQDQVGKTFIKEIKCTKCLRYLADPKQKIYKTDKIESKQFNSMEQWIIEEFCIDSERHLWYIVQR